MNAPLELLDDRIEALLGQAGLDAAARPGRVKLLKSEHATLMISPSWHDGRGWCRIAALLLVEVHPSLDLLHRILRANSDMTIGALQLFEDRSLALVINLPDAALDAETFAWCVRYAGWKADVLVPTLRAVAAGRSGAAILEEQP